MERNFKLTIAYDGTAYYGWQKQPDRITVQGTLEKVLSRVVGKEVATKGAGRTDRGVHAWAQVANFKAETYLSTTDIYRALNALLPEDIRVKKVEEVPLGFDARRDAISRTYYYFLYVGNLLMPFDRLYKVLVNRHLSIDKMRRAAGMLLGKHDFTAFSGGGSSRKYPFCTVYAVGVDREADNVSFYIEADTFLYHMVRNIVSKLVDVGTEKISVEDFVRIIRSKDRSKGNSPFPAKGLFLWKIKYK